jgi:amino acid adenylation domain-containing protein
MEDLQTLRDRARAGDLQALQELRDRGFFGKKAAQESTTDRRRAPLSYHQDRLWFIDRFETGVVYDSSPIYHNIPLILHITGPIDSGALEQSLNVVVNRHDALRTRIVGEKDQGFQEVRRRDAIALSIEHLTDSDGTSHDRLIDLALEDARRPFVLHRDLPVRARLLHVSPVEALLVVTVHHIVVDRSSMQIIAEELADIYRGQTSWRDSEPPRPAMQYPELAQWQRSLSDDAFEPYLFYWKRRLGKNPSPLELPSSRVRPAVHTFTDARHTFTLEGALVDRLKALSQQEHCPESVVLLAAFEVVLHRYARQEEIVVGTSVPCRTQPRTERLVGPVANLLVLRSRLKGDISFKSVLEQVNERLTEALRYQEMPFDRLVRDLKPDKDMSRTALFDVLFQYEQPEPTLDMGAARAQVIDTNIGYGKYDLHVCVRRTGDGMRGDVVYNADLYDAPLIERLMRHFVAALDAVVAAPEQRIDDVDLLSREEKAQQLIAWNHTDANYPTDRTIHELFEEQVETTPDRIAVIVGDRWLTYRALNDRANQIAHHLRKRGVAPDMLVALCLDRSDDMIASILGVLKAGGAYLPIDPAYPEDRQRFMLENSRVSHLVTKRGLVRDVTDTVGSVVELDTYSAAISSETRVSPASRTAPENLAYCIYTSGSTGKPKGVLLDHRNVVRLMRNEKFQFDFSSDDVWTMFHSYCFDFSVWEMYGALLYGGTLVIVPESARDPQSFLAVLRRHGVTVLNQTPSAFSLLAQHALSGRDQPHLALRYVIFGGEALDPAQLTRWRGAYPNVSLVNMYGITETTVHVTFKELTPDSISSHVSNIGTPIPTTSTYIMDGRQDLLPVGVLGELHVGGEGVARGYLHRPDLTGEKLVPHPAGNGARIYRSGDLGRYLAGGEIEYLGRIDHQVKIRGFRIEPGEIESAICGHRSVREAVVVAREDAPGAKRLVAYLVPADGVSPEIPELRNSLRAKLPEHMVPSAFVVLESLPLTSNQKVDRRALPEPAATRAAVDARFVAAETETQKKIAGVWQQALGVDKIGIDDNFFDAGGHSLLMIEVQWKLTEALGREVTLVEMFENPTVRSLAEYVSRTPGTKDHAVSQTRAQERVAAVKQRAQKRRRGSPTLE